MKIEIKLVRNQTAPSPRKKTLIRIAALLALLALVLAIPASAKYFDSGSAVFSTELDSAVYTGTSPITVTGTAIGLDNTALFKPVTSTGSYAPNNFATQLWNLVKPVLQDGYGTYPCNIILIYNDGGGAHYIYNFSQVDYLATTTGSSYPCLVFRGSGQRLGGTDIYAGITISDQYTYNYAGYPSGSIGPGYYIRITTDGAGYDFFMSAATNYTLFIRGWVCPRKMA